jgi:uncharacterized protein (TIGR02453 family)
LENKPIPFLFVVTPDLPKHQRMLQPSTLKFLSNLKKNNNKPWFDEHRKDYETAKADFYTMVQELITAIAVFDEPIGLLEVKNCVFRINRDVRFSKDKSPYKNNLACYFNRAGKKSNGAGYYLHIEPGGCMAGGGIWMPETATLQAIRQEIDYNFNSFKKLTESRSFKQVFPAGIDSSQSLQRPPKGYEADNPAIDYLKMKSFVVFKNFTDQQVVNRNFVVEVAHTFKAMKPFIDFLNTAVEL